MFENNSLIFLISSVLWLAAPEGDPEEEKQTAHVIFLVGKWFDSFFCGLLFSWLIDWSLKEEIWLQMNLTSFHFPLHSFFFGHNSFVPSDSKQWHPEATLMTLLYHLTGGIFQEKLTNRTQGDLWPNRWEHLILHSLAQKGQWVHF